MLKFFQITAVALMILATEGVSADEKQFGDFSIHYSAFKSDFLTPPIAKAYGITRSKNRAVLNVTVTQKAGKGPAQPVEALVEGKAVNVYQQRKPLNLREIKEKDAVYYIAEFPVAHLEWINFEITASHANTKIGTVKFTQQFFH